MVLASIIGIGLLTGPASAAESQPLAFHGTDVLGLAIITYEGQTYHLTNGDTLAGETFLYNNGNLNEIVEEEQKKIEFTIQFGLNWEQKHEKEWEEFALDSVKEKFHAIERSLTSTSQ